MSTQAEHLTSRRDDPVSRPTYLTKLVAWIESQRQAYRTYRHEMRLREMVKTLPPALLDDIGLALDVDGLPVLELARQNPHVIVTKILHPSSGYYEPR